MKSTIDDAIIYAALAASALAAVITAPSSAGAAADKLKCLLMQEAVPEMIMLAGAIGAPATFPVSP